MQSISNIKSFGKKVKFSKLKTYSIDFHTDILDEVTSQNTS